MSGLLDKKTRVLDFIITDTGRNELTRDELNFKYIAFSDIHAIYDRSPDADHTMLLSYEATSLPSDLLITDLDNNGLILSTRMSGTSDKNITQVNILSKLTTASFDAFTYNAIKPLQNQFLLGNKQRFTDSDEFILTPLSMSFTIRDDAPIPQHDTQVKSINELPNIFQDDDFKTQNNFRFLKPINRNGTSVFDYDDITAKRYPRTTTDVLRNVKNNEAKTLNITETSIENNLIVQFFEIINTEGSEKELRKLKIVEHRSTNINDNKIYFVGKTDVDSRNVETFIKLFTLLIIK